MKVQIVFWTDNYRIVTPDHSQRSDRFGRSTEDFFTFPNFRDICLHLQSVGIHRDVEEIVVIPECIQPADHRFRILGAAYDAVDHVGHQRQAVIKTARGMVCHDRILFAKPVQNPFRKKGRNVGRSAGTDDPSVSACILR